MIVIDSSGSIELFADGPHAHEHGLAMADSMMLAFARENDAAFVTTDSGFAKG